MVPELVRDGVDGLIYDGSVRDLSRCMRRLLDDAETSRTVIECVSDCQSRFSR